MMCLYGDIVMFGCDSNKPRSLYHFLAGRESGLQTSIGQY